MVPQKVYRKTNNTGTRLFLCQRLPKLVELVGFFEHQEMAGGEIDSRLQPSNDRDAAH
jgi:hypothetical protein